MRKTIFLLALAVSLCQFTTAQQTIVNVPSADVLDKGKVYVEFDASYKFDRSSSLGRFSSFVPRIVVGVGKKIEVGMNVVGNFNPGSDSTTFVPTIKAKVYDKENWAIVTGANIYLPARNRAYNIGSYTYAQVIPFPLRNCALRLAEIVWSMSHELQFVVVFEWHSTSATN